MHSAGTIASLADAAAQCVEENKTDHETKGEKEMSEPKFTPGSWKANIYNREFCDTGDYYTERTVESPFNVCVCQVFEHDNKQHTGEEEADANAALIAAAPEMYDWLNWLIEMDMTVASPNDKEKIKNVLKKARGEA